MDGQQEMGPKVVEAEVIYQAEMDHPATFYLGGEEGETDDVVNDSRVVPIHNVRGEALSYDREGFVLLPHKTRVTNFRDPEEIQKIYRPELERIRSGSDWRIKGRGLERGGAAPCPALQGFWCCGHHLSLPDNSR